jgi:hypothetical protein
MAFLILFKHFVGLNVPYLICILSDCTVATELTTTNGVSNGSLGPKLLIAVGFINFLLSLNVGLKVSGQQIPVVVVQNGGK